MLTTTSLGSAAPASTAQRRPRSTSSGSDWAPTSQNTKRSKLCITPPSMACAFPISHYHPTQIRTRRGRRRSIEEDLGHCRDMEHPLSFRTSYFQQSLHGGSVYSSRFDLHKAHRVSNTSKSEDYFLLRMGCIASSFPFQLMYTRTRRMQSSRTRISRESEAVTSPSREFKNVTTVKWNGGKHHYIARKASNLRAPVRMATSSTPGGNIPNFIVQKSTPGQVANDVPMFLKWLHSDREYFKNGIEGDHEQPEAPSRAEPPAR